MPDPGEALSLDETEKFYANVAFDKLVHSYEEEQKGEHAQAVRRLAARVAAHNNARRPYQTADMAKWQQQIVAAQGNPEKIKAVMRAWWSELLQVAVDPAGTLADAMLPLVDQSVAQGVGQILVTIEQKMKAVASDPSLSEDPQEGPVQALQMVLQFVKDGLQQLQAGQPMWRDDPHLNQLAQQIQQQQQQQQPQQQQQQPQQQPQTPVPGAPPNQ